MNKKKYKITLSTLSEDESCLIEYLVIMSLYKKGENPIPKNHKNYSFLTKSNYDLKNIETKQLKDLYKKLKEAA